MEVDVGKRGTEQGTFPYHFIIIQCCLQLIFLHTTQKP